MENADIVGQMVDDKNYWKKEENVQNITLRMQIPNSKSAQIIKLDIDILKIDGSLIKEIATNKNIELAVKTINDFAKALNIKTVAEFVHNKDVYEKVCKLEVDLSQGFYIHEPEFLI